MDEAAFKHLAYLQEVIKDLRGRLQESQQQQAHALLQQQQTQAALQSDLREMQQARQEDALEYAATIARLRDCVEQATGAAHKVEAGVQTDKDREVMEPTRQARLSSSKSSARLHSVLKDCKKWL
jgi:hypothetical protein